MRSTGGNVGERPPSVNRLLRRPPDHQPYAEAPYAAAPYAEAPYAAAPYAVAPYAEVPYTETSYETSYAEAGGGLNPPRYLRLRYRLRNAIRAARSVLPTNR